MYSYIFIAILTIYGIATTYFCIKFAMTVLRVQDSLEVAINTIDEKYNNISEILQRPLFYDSPEVRRVLEEIGHTRDALHQIAYDLSAKLENEDIEG